MTSFLNVKIEDGSMIGLGSESPNKPQSNANSTTGKKPLSQDTHTMLSTKGEHLYIREDHKAAGC